MHVLTSTRSLWLQGVAVTLPSLTQEFGVSPTNVRFTTCALFVGLCVGATFWGVASDLIGRRLAFNLSLLICGVFGICVASSPNWIGYVLFFSFLSSISGVGRS